MHFLFLFFSEGIWGDWAYKTFNRSLQRLTQSYQPKKNQSPGISGKKLWAWRWLTFLGMLQYLIGQHTHMHTHGKKRCLCHEDREKSNPILIFPVEKWITEGLGQYHDKIITHMKLCSSKSITLFSVFCVSACATEQMSSTGWIHVELFPLGGKYGFMCVCLRGGVFFLGVQMYVWYHIWVTAVVPLGCKAGLGIRVFGWGKIASIGSLASIFWTRSAGLLINEAFACKNKALEEPSSLSCEFLVVMMSKW